MNAANINTDNIYASIQSISGYNEITSFITMIVLSSQVNKDIAQSSPASNLVEKLVDLSVWMI